ncbi:MAG: thioredoxin fold domain-containing protein [Thermodesulfobacteriota bacterium]
MGSRFYLGALLALCLVLGAGCGDGSEKGPAQTAQASVPTVLVFGLGPRCRYCVELKKEIDRVTEQTGAAVRFRDILVDRDKAMVQKHRVLLSPTLVFLDAAGAEVHRHQGLLDAEQILERLAAHGLWPGKG